MCCLCLCVNLLNSRSICTDDSLSDKKGMFHTYQFEIGFDFAMLVLSKVYNLIRNLKEINEKKISTTIKDSIIMMN